MNQSEKKGRFIIQELDEEINVMENYEKYPINFFDREKNFTKKTRHSSICNNNKIIHLLHNQSENPNLNQNFSTFIFEENSKNWIDFDLLWTKFSKVHCDVSENNMEKIFNYTDIKSDDEGNSFYFNDSLNNNICRDYNENPKLIISNENIIINIDLDKSKAKNVINPSNHNLTNIQTTHDISQSNTADICTISNITANQVTKNLCYNQNKAFNNNSNYNNNKDNNLKICKLSSNNYLNYDIYTNNYFANNNKESNINNSIHNVILFNNKSGNPNFNAENGLLNSQNIISSDVNSNVNEKVNFLNTITNIENTFKYSKNNICNKNNLSNKKIDSEISNSNDCKSQKNSIISEKTRLVKTEDPSLSPSKIKNLEINFCEKRIINSPAFSPINSDYCPKLNKFNLDLHSLNENNQINNMNNVKINNGINENLEDKNLNSFKDIEINLQYIQNKSKSKLKSNDKFYLIEDYFREKNKYSSFRQKRIFSEFNPNFIYQKKFNLSNLKISCNVNNFSLFPETQKVPYAQNKSKKKVKKSKKKNLNLQISQKIEIEISAGYHLENNTNNEKDKLPLDKVNSFRNNKINFLVFENKVDNEIKEKYVCNSCRHKNFIVD